MDTNLPDTFDQARLLALGYGEERADVLIRLQSSLFAAVVSLKERESKPFLYIDPYDESDNYDDIFLHDDILLPAWHHFAEALSSSDPVPYLCLCQMEISQKLGNLLTEALKTANLSFLELENNNLGSSGVKCVVNAVKASTSLKGLSIMKNQIRSCDDVKILFVCCIDAVQQTDENFNGMYFDENKVYQKDGSSKYIGEDMDAIAAIIPAFDHLLNISLSSNSIGVQAVRRIANCLASDPHIERLVIKDNLLDNECALLLAEAVKKNTKLRVLELNGHKFTALGVLTLATCVYDNASPNAVFDSNSSCCMMGVDKDDLFSQLNKLESRAVNSEIKLLCFFAPTRKNNIWGGKVPIQIMPRLLSFVQGREELAEHLPGYDGLATVYRYLLQWNMPLLYTSKTGPEPRRSRRIREKMVRQYMGKKK